MMGGPRPLSVIPLWLLSLVELHSNQNLSSAALVHCLYFMLISFIKLWFPFRSLRLKINEGVFFFQEIHVRYSLAKDYKHTAKTGKLKLHLKIIFKF